MRRPLPPAGWRRSAARVRRPSVRRPSVARLLAACLLAASPLTPRVTRAQIPTNEAWFTIRTRHFAVHYARGTEALARRAATAAERAYANLATELVPPRGIIDVVLTDASDASNGAATTFPRNHVIIQARPPVDQTSLENYDDWMTLVLQHEVTHVFHLDRTRGWWRLAQGIFGRNPVLFPNFYTPSWLSEGVAVYYESRFTSGGRLEGTYQDAVARAAALDRAVPRLDQLSLTTSRYPYGQSVYIYGSFLVDQMARAGGPGSMRRYIEKTSAAPVPFLLDRIAKRSFGETFTHAWQRWRDSVSRSVTRAEDGLTDAPAAGWSLLPHGGRYLIHPRWLGDTSVVYLWDSGRESPGVYTTSLSGTVTRLRRTSSLDVVAARADGGAVWAQADFLDRLHSRSDLYALRDGQVRRLTTGARLSTPDVRRDGEIVAVQTLPGTTRLARVSGDGRHVTPITEASLDVQWTGPRWSPDGARIAAIRLSHGVSEILVLDTLGHVLQSLVRARAVIRSPAWSADGGRLFFTSDVAGASEIYDAVVPPAGDRATAAPSSVTRRTNSPTGLYDVDANGPGAAAPLVSSVLLADGLHLVTRHVGQLGTEPPTARVPSYGDSSRVSSYTGNAVATPSTVTPDTGRAVPYSPWRTLLPAYWSPLFSSGGAYGTLVGALTSGEDVIGRHSYQAQALVNTSTHHIDALASYQYSRFINPILDVSAEQDWSYLSVYSNQTRVGRLDERAQVYGAHATFVRPRAFTYASLSLGGEMETREYLPSPSSLGTLLLPFYQRDHQYPAVVATALFSNAQRPTLSISPEDGVELSLSERERWERGTNGSSSSGTVLVSTLYKSLPLPGFAHHVLALRAAGGITDNRSPGEYSLGGISGSAVSIIPGLTVGDQARTFPVRGFAPGTELGIRAVTGSLEYRAPLTLPSRGLGLWPAFVDRTSLTLFADAGKAYCPRSALAGQVSGVASPACSGGDPTPPILTSIGAELNLDAALQFDVPYRFRLGLAHPLHGRTEFGTRSLSTYVTLGGSF